jgi:hypothetical protein
MWQGRSSSAAARSRRTPRLRPTCRASSSMFAAGLIECRPSRT